jgi:hypothetical protein
MRPRTNISGGHCGTRTGAGPLVIETIGTTRIAEQDASHPERRYSRSGLRAVQARRG